MRLTTASAYDAGVKDAEQAILAVVAAVAEQAGAGAGDAVLVGTAAVMQALAAGVLGLDAQELKGLGSPLGLFVDAGQALGELHQPLAHLVHGEPGDGGYRRKA